MIQENDEKIINIKQFYLFTIKRVKIKKKLIKM